jgi:predicted lipoprotein with Yx(FWY)xxD motif
MTHPRKKELTMIHKRLTLLGLAVPLAALAVAGCGSSNNSSSSSPSVPKLPTGRTATIGVSGSSLGNILVDSQGRTVYLFKKDTTSKSTCAGACAASWPPVRATGKPTAAGGAKASMLGTTKRSDGKPQVTYHGHPLYTFSGDQNAGDVNGQGVNAFGAVWWAVSPAGNQVTTKPSSGTTGGY